MQCLNCKTEMVNNDVTTQKGELSYDMCEKCGSLWLDAGELDKMAFTVEGSIEFCSDEDAKVSDRKRKKCPRCDNYDLSPVKFLGVTDIVLDHCKNCGGFWLDGGELNLIDEELAKDMPVSGKGFSEFVNNVHVPYWFQRVQKKSHETDFKIDVLPILGSTLVKPTEDKCPVCRSPLNLYKVLSLEYEGCHQCKGVWLLKDELRKLKNSVLDGKLRWMNDEIENIEKASARPTNRHCVKCKDSRMVSAVFGHSSIVLDWCPRCHGTWLDRGGLLSIVEYLKDESAKTSPGEIKKDVIKDVKRVLAGGPESRFDELVDAESAISALANARIFEHPDLVKLCMNATHLGLPM